MIKKTGPRLKLQINSVNTVLVPFIGIMNKTAKIRHKKKKVAIKGNDSLRLNTIKETWRTEHSSLTSSDLPVFIKMSPRVQTSEVQRVEDGKIYSFSLSVSSSSFFSQRQSLKNTRRFPQKTGSEVKLMALRAHYKV